MPEIHRSQDETSERSFFDRYANSKAIIRLFDSLPGAHFYAKDANHRYVGANLATLENVFGLTDESELLGRTDSEFQPPALAEAYHAEDRRVMDIGEIIANQVWLVPHVSGTPRWYVSTKTPLSDSSGNVVGIAGVMYPIETPEDQATYFQELSPVVDYIEAHYTDMISMKEMAAMVEMSTTRFNQRFRVILRMSPTEYVLSLRIQYAQRLLSTSSLSLIEIAGRVGFYDQSHFNKRFRRLTGMTPKDYRTRFRR